MIQTLAPISAMSPKNYNLKQTAGVSPRRLTIYFQDDAVRQRSEDTVQQLLSAASSPNTSSTSALLAKKALKYRKVYERMEGVDVTSPAFDASKFLGVDWCKTQNLKAHCGRSH